MGFMLKWALSPLLAVIAARFFIRSRDGHKNRRVMLFFGWLFFSLSWAAFSSSIILMALLIVGLIHFAPQGSNGKSVPTLEIKFSALILATSVALALIGLRLAELNPPVNPLVGNAQETIDGVLGLDPLNALVLAIASTLASVLSVIIALPLQNNELNSWLIIAFRDYLAALIAMLGIVLGAIYVFGRSLPSKNLIVTFGLLFIAQAFISVARTPFIHRYQTLWVLIAILVVLSLFNWLKTLRFGVIKNLLIGIVITASLLSLWHIFFNSLSMATIERERDLVNSSTLRDPDSCLAEASMSLDQFAPTISAIRVCSLLETLDERAWITE